MNCSDGGCLTAAVMFGMKGVRILAAGVVAVTHRRREHLLRDAPFGHRPVVVMWRKRIFRLR